MIFVKKNIINIIFQNIEGTSYNIRLSEDCPIEIAFIYYLMSIGRIMDKGSKKIFFCYNKHKLEIEDKTPIKEIFQNNPLPIIRVKILN